MKNFQTLKVVISWLLFSEEEAVKLPSENRRRRKLVLDFFLSGIGLLPLLGFPDLRSFPAVPQPFERDEAGSLEDLLSARAKVLYVVCHM